MPNERSAKPALPDNAFSTGSKAPCHGSGAEQAALLRQLKEIDKQVGEKGKLRRHRAAGEKTTDLGRAPEETPQCTVAIKKIRDNGGYAGIAALKISRMLAPELFVRSSHFAQVHGGLAHTFEHYRPEWLAFAGTLASLTVPLEIIYALQSVGISRPDDRPIRIFFGVPARARSESLLAERCRQGIELLRQILSSSLPDVEIVPATRGELEQLVGTLNGEAVEFCRRVADLPGRFCDHNPETSAGPRFTSGTTEPDVATIVSWRPPEDTWHRLLSVLAMQPGPAAMIVHARAIPVASPRLREQLSAGLETMEQAAKAGAALVKTMASVPRHTAAVLLEAASEKLLALGGPMIAARVFAVGAVPPSPALLATISTSLHVCETGSSPLPGGMRMKRVPSQEVLNRLSDPAHSVLFSPEEAIAFLRTPIPDSDGTYIEVTDVRSTLLRGQPGDDAPLGIIALRDREIRVRMDPRARADHTYVVGQTGTGKSTFLLQQALYDIGQGRGVGVLDPHGTLIDDILCRMPADRADDVVLLDPTDVERPVPFNPLVITEENPHRYRQIRDLVINDLYADVEHAYAANWSQVSGPMFETHLRGILGTLLGLDPQESPWIPNLGLLRAVYYNSSLRKLLLKRLDGQDRIVEDFMQEAEGVTSSNDGSLRNMAPYVTSKFNRFLNDRAMRNVVCQSRSIDLREIVDQGKILLCYLGRGRFGEHSASLLASALLSRLRHAVMGRGANASLPPFHLFADECQLFADGRLTELLAEGRKFGLAITLAHQYLDQLPAKVREAVVGNVGTLVALRLSPADAERSATLFAPAFLPRELASLPNFRAVARSHGCLGMSPFTLQIEAPTAVARPERGKLIRQIARLRHGREWREVEKEIDETYRTYLGVE